MRDGSVLDGPLSAYAGRRVVVLGSAGFIGRSLTGLLVRIGAHVVGLTRRQGTGGREGSAGPGTLRLVAGDATDSTVLRDLLRAERPAVTFNMAGYGVRPGETNADVAQRINSDLPARLPGIVAPLRDLDWLGNALVHAGTQAEYGPLEVMDESVEGQPRSLYGRTKLAGTMGLGEAARELALPAVVARIFNVYGPGEASHRLLPMLMERAGDEDPIELTSGVQRRDFSYVDDVSEGLLRLGASAPVFGEVVNLAVGRPIPVRELVLEAAQQLHISRSRLRFGALPDRGTEVPSPAVSTRRMKELTGWLPSTSLEAGIRQTVARAPQSFPQSNSE